MIAGGAGSAVLEALERHAVATPVLQLGLPDRFIDQGDPGIQIADARSHGRRHRLGDPRTARGE